MCRAAGSLGEPQGLLPEGGPGGWPRGRPEPQPGQILVEVPGGSVHVTSKAMEQGAETAGVPGEGVSPKGPRDLGFYPLQLISDVLA